MGVFSKKRKDGSTAWFYRFNFEGITYCEMAGATKTQALRAQEKRRTELLNGEHGLPQKLQNIRFTDFSQKFLVEREQFRSLRRYVVLVNHLVSYFKKHATMSSIQPEDIRNYRVWRKGHGVANGTVNREVSCLRRMFNLAIEWNHARLNPVLGIKPMHEPPKKERYVTQEEANALLAAAPEYFKPILITAFSTGMRKYEILSLKWEQVELFDMHGGEIELLETKNGEKRYVPINSTLRQIFENLPRKSEFVFLGLNGKPLKDVRKPMMRTLKAAGIKIATFHDFRHSWASWMSEQGVDTYTIMEIGGWKDMKTLMRYLHRTRSYRINGCRKSC